MKNKSHVPESTSSYRKKILADLFLEEETRGEQRSTFFYLFIIAPILLLCSIIVAIIEQFHINSIINCIIATAILMYYAINFVILKRKIYKPFMKYISVTTNALFMTFLLYGYSIQTGWIHTIRTVVITGYILSIVSTGLYENPIVPVYAAVLSALSYSGLVLIGIVVVKVRTVIVETFYAPSYSFDIFIFYIIVFFVTAAIVSSLNRRYRQMLERSLDSEAYSKVVKRANAQKTRFFINLAHETKTPLTLISNYIDEYSKKHGEEREIDIIRQNLEKLKIDMLSFLDFEKLRRMRVFYNHERVVDFSGVLAAQSILFKELALHKGIDLTSEIAEKIYIRIDPSALERIINNLIENAVKYTEPGGKVGVTLVSDKQTIAFSVVDTGPGIPEKQQEKIFRPFYQLSHMKRNVQGIGMGLAIVKKIVGEVNGRISIESSPGKGSRFTVTLSAITPKDREGIIEELDSPRTITTFGEVGLLAPEHRAGVPNVFIVEDNRAMLRYLQDKLCTEFNVYYAFNGKEALERIGGIPRPDVIVSDIMMDTMDGFEFRDKLMEADTYHSIPFIYVTALTSHNEKIKALKKGAVEYLYKPFHIDELVEKLRSIIKVQDALSRKNLIEMSYRLRDHLSIADSNNGNSPAAHRTHPGQASPKALLAEYGISKRQIKILALLGAGLERKEISSKLDIKINTVNTHIKRMFKKCGVSNRVELLNILSGS
jgi:two-component system, sensor histidine kinase ChiS